MSCVGRDQRKILRKGSSLEEKPWRFERLCQCGNLWGGVNSTLLYWSQSKPIGEMTVQSSPFQSESSNSVMSHRIGHVASSYMWLVKFKNSLK